MCRRDRATLSCGSVVVRQWGHVGTEIGSLGGARHTSVSVVISLSVHGSTSVFARERAFSLVSPLVVLHARGINVCVLCMLIRSRRCSSSELVPWRGGWVETG